MIPWVGALYLIQHGGRWSAIIAGVYIGLLFLIALDTASGERHPELHRLRVSAGAAAVVALAAAIAASLAAPAYFTVLGAQRYLTAIINALNPFDLSTLLHTLDAAWVAWTLIAVLLARMIWLIPKARITTLLYWMLVLVATEYCATFLRSPKAPTGLYTIGTAAVVIFLWWRAADYMPRRRIAAANMAIYRAAFGREIPPRFLEPGYVPHSILELRRRELEAMLIRNHDQARLKAASASAPVADMKQAVAAGTHRNAAGAAAPPQQSGLTMTVAPAWLREAFGAVQEARRGQLYDALLHALGTGQQGALAAAFVTPTAPTNAAWMDKAFNATPSDRRKLLARSVRGILHPDAGGDQLLFVAWTNAAERHAS
jgi:hypothetical protein